MGLKGLVSARWRISVLAVCGVFAVVTSGCLEYPPESTPKNVDVVDTPNGSVTATVAPGLTIDVSVADTAGLPPVPENFSSPFGALAVNVSGVPVGGAVEVTIDVNMKVDRAYKLIGGAWERFTHDGTTGATVSPDGMSVELDLVDGGRGDSDGVANGVIVDPLDLGSPTGVSITTGSTPLITQGVPYSFQLEADGPDPDQVTWSVLYSDPIGLTLDADGLISGTTNTRSNSAVPALMRVQATDGTTTDTKLLFFSWTPANPIYATATGVSLPDGEAIDFIDSIVGEMGYQQKLRSLSILADGSLVDPVAASVDAQASLRAGNPMISPEGTQVVTRYVDVSTGTPVFDPYTVADADTGEPVAVLSETGDPSQGIKVAWSPDGLFLSVTRSTPNGNNGQIYDTSTWDVIRQLTDFGEEGEVRWSTNGSQIFSTGTPGLSPDPATTIEVLNAPSFDTSTALTLPGPDCHAQDISRTGLIAVQCDGAQGYNPTLAIISAVDGSVIPIEVPACILGALVPPCFSWFQFPRFSPDGEHIVWTGIRLVSMDPMLSDFVVAVKGLAPGSPTSVVAEFAFQSGSGHFGFMGLRWR